MVRLRNGENIAGDLVANVMASLRVLAETDPISLIELARACRDDDHILFGGSVDRLLGLALIQSVTPAGRAVIHDVPRAVVLSATKGDWGDLRLVSPVADRGEQA
jgi:hypothetical protein